MFFTSDEILLQILNLSFAGSVVILAVLALRLLLRRAPKVFSYALWSVVFFRLLCPISFESTASILPTRPAPIPMDIATQATPSVETGIPFVNKLVNEALPPVIEGGTASANPMQILIAFWTAIWFLGLAALLIYSMLSLLRLRSRLRDAAAQGDRVYHTARIETPFVLGVFAPKIYLPTGLTPQERAYVLLHERTHIRRLDHIVKLIAFAALALHWFNPLVWLAFFLLTRDMEMSCDEAVIRKLGTEVKCDYSRSLLSLATGRRSFAPTPLAFGEGDTKSRIRHVLHYKKPAFWVLAAALLLVAVACVTLLLDPLGEQEFPANDYKVIEILYVIPLSSRLVTVDNAPYYRISGQSELIRYSQEKEEADSFGVMKKERLTRAARRALISFSSSENKALVDRLEKVQTIYRVDSSSGTILLMQERNNTLLIGEARTSPQGELQLWTLFGVAPLIDLGAADQLHKYRTAYLGDNAAVGNLIDSLQLSQVVDYTGFSLQTDKHPYQLTLKFRPDPASSGATAAFEQAYLQREATLLFSLIGNLEQIYLLWGEDVASSLGISIPREAAESLFGYKYFARGETPDGISEMLRELVGLLPGHMDEMQAREDQRNAAISAAIMDTRGTASPAGRISTQAHQILKSESGTRKDENGVDQNTLRLYIYYAVYTFLPREDGFENFGGTTDFALLDFDISDEGVYICTNYQRASDMKGQFEETLGIPAQFRANMDERYAPAALQSCFMQAVAEGGVNADLAIERLLTLALKGDSAAAADAHFQLKAYGDLSIQYCYRAFLEGKQTGPRADLMAQLCQSIAAPYEQMADTWELDPALQGQAWFDAYRAAVEQKVLEEGQESVQLTRYDAGWLLRLLSE